MGLSTSDCLYVKRISVRVPYLREASSTRALPLCSGFPIGMEPSYQKDLCAKGVDTAMRKYTRPPDSRPPGPATLPEGMDGAA